MAAQRYICYCSYIAPQPFHPYRSVWYVPDQGMDYTILDT